VQGLRRLGVVHETTLPYSPYQNGKQESFWGPVEGRLLSMIEGCADLTLAQLNVATQAWVEMEYNRKVHSEIGGSPLSRFIANKDVGRPCPDFEALRQAFTAESSRTQRRSDGTISVEGVRFELPSRYRHLKRVDVRYAAWDLSHVYLSDARGGQILARLYPQDKHRNADGRRRSKEAIAGSSPEVAPPEPEREGMAPLLRKLIAEYAATGQPPAYLPKDETPPPEGEI
jgi:putative transposase